MKKPHPEAGISQSDFNQLKPIYQKGLMQLYKERSLTEKAIAALEKLEKIHKPAPVQLIDFVKVAKMLKNLKTQMDYIPENVQKLIVEKYGDEDAKTIFSMAELPDKEK